MVLAILLFLAFSILAAGGVFWIVVTSRGPLAAVAAAVGTLLAFFLLAAGLVWLLTQFAR